MAVMKCSPPPRRAPAGRSGAELRDGHRLAPRSAPRPLGKPIHRPGLATADTDALLERRPGRPLRLPRGDEAAGDRRPEHLTELALRRSLSSNSPCHATGVPERPALPHSGAPRSLRGRFLVDHPHPLRAENRLRISASGESWAYDNGSAVTWRHVGSAQGLGGKSQSRLRSAFVTYSPRPVAWP